MSGRYQMLCEIGKGAYGTAWLVKSRDTGHRRVMKVIKVSKLSEKELDLCVTEVAVLAHCQHPNIICYTESFIQDRALNIVMEFADGGDLLRKIHQQKGIHFSREVVLDWFVQICLALAYIHGKNILHRDLKTQNIFLTGSGIIKLGDFGIARILRDQADHALTTIGTPFYISPEICQKKPYNSKTDMWSAGCVLYEMCLLRVPFDAQDFTGLVLKILSAQYTPVPRHFGSVISELVKRLLNVSPDARPSAEQVLCLPGVSCLAAVHIKRHGGLEAFPAKTSTSTAKKPGCAVPKRDSQTKKTDKRLIDTGPDSEEFSFHGKQSTNTEEPEVKTMIQRNANGPLMNGKASKNPKTVQNPDVSKLAPGGTGMVRHERASSEPCTGRKALRQQNDVTSPTTRKIKIQNIQAGTDKSRGREDRKRLREKKPNDIRMEMLTQAGCNRQTYSLSTDACRRLSEARASLSETVRKQRQALSLPDTDEDIFTDSGMADDDVFSKLPSAKDRQSARPRVNSKTYVISSSG